MSTQQSQLITQLIVRKPLELDAGLVVPTGRYPGLLKETAFQPLSGNTQIITTYWLALSRQMIAVLKKSDRANYVSVEYEVTRHVKDGSVGVG
jgi:hypothetical protein